LKLIEKIFGKKEDVSPAISLQFSELPDWIETESKKHFSELQPRISQKYDDISTALGNLSVSRDILKDATYSENVYRRMAKAGTSNRDNLIKNINIVIERTVIPEDADLLNVSEFYKNTKSVIKTCLENTSRSQEYVKLLFPEGYKGIVIDLKHMDTVLDELIEIINNVKHELDAYHKLPGEIGILDQTRKQIKEKIKNIQDIEKKYESLTNELPLREKELEEFKKSEEFIKAHELEKQIIILQDHLSEINSSVKGLFTPLSKALLRMEKQDESGRHLLSEDSRKNLRLLIEDPVSILGINIDPFLNEMQELVENGTLGLKQQKMNKTVEQIKKLTDSDILSSIDNERKSYSTELVKAREELNGLTVYKKKNQIERRISDCLSMINQTKHSMDQERKEQIDLSDKLEQSKIELESDLTSVFKKEIKIIYLK
jgi:hypothetical protein